MHLSLQYYHEALQLVGYHCQSILYPWPRFLDSRCLCSCISHCHDPVVSHIPHWLAMTVTNICLSTAQPDEKETGYVVHDSIDCKTLAGQYKQHITRYPPSFHMQCICLCYGYNHIQILSSSGQPFPNVIILHLLPVIACILYYQINLMNLWLVREVEQNVIPCWGIIYSNILWALPRWSWRCSDVVWWACLPGCINLFPNRSPFSFNFNVGDLSHWWMTFFVPSTGHVGSTLHSPTCPIGLRSDCSESKWSLSRVQLDSVYSIGLYFEVYFLSKVQVESKWSPSGVRVDQSTQCHSSNFKVITLL
jgi:hypothetical protein